MTASAAKGDKHFPLLALDHPLRRLFGSTRKYCAYVEQNQIAADLGCGPGFFTLALAEKVGAKGRVYAVDSDERAIRALETKARRQGCRNIEAHASSAADLSFIEDESVDFVLAAGLLCSMAPEGHPSAVNEIKRVLKPSGRAFLAVARGAISAVDEAEWEGMLEGFRVERRNHNSLWSFTAGRWALVQKVHP